MDSHRPYNIDRRIRIDNRINEFSNYVSEYGIFVLAKLLGNRKQIMTYGGIMERTANEYTKINLQQLEIC
jgi:hypothetical protein